MKRAAPWVLGLLLCLAALGAGCSEPAKTPPEQFTVYASGEMAGLASSLASSLNSEQKAISVTVTVVRDRLLATSVLSNTGAVAIGYRLDPATPISQTVFALDALAVSVAFTNPVSALSLAQMREIYAGRVENWQEMGGRDVAVTVFSREEGAPARALFDGWALGDGTRLSRNALLVSSDQAVVASLEAADGGIGYALLRTLSQNARPLRLDGEPPSVAGIRQGRYPLVLPVAAITAGTPGAAAARFISYLWGNRGQTLIQEAGFVTAR